MIFGRYTTRQVAEKRLPDFVASKKYADWWTVREEEPPAHLPEYRWAVVFEAPANAPRCFTDHLDCMRCHGDGEVSVNPGWPDPQCEDSVRCERCGGSGLERAAA